MDQNLPPTTPSPNAAPMAAEPRRGVSGGKLRAALVLVGLGLLANAGLMLWNRLSPTYPSEITFDARAFGQSGPLGSGVGGGTGGGPGGAGGVGVHGFYMMPAQLGMNAWGLYILDVESGTVCVYRATPETSRFKLMAVRYFRNDRFLIDFNNDSPTPREVLKQVEQQRQREQIEAPTTAPAGATGGGGAGK